DDIGRTLAGFPGVVEVHDLHVWEVSSGFPALSAHVTVEAGGDCPALPPELQAGLRDRFDLHHTPPPGDPPPRPVLPAPVRARPGAGARRPEERSRRGPAVSLRLAVYGLLLDGAGPAGAPRLRDGGRLVGPATIPGALVDLGAYPGLVDGPGTVRGELWELL